MLFHGHYSIHNDNQIVEGQGIVNQTYQVQIEQFQGPLDLLLHLVNRFEIDIYDIPVAKISQQYMEYIHTMQQLELNIASEYLVMAATLLELKSKMLLPKPEIEDLDEYEEDPREDLMQRLIEYRKYKEAANQLKEIEIEAKPLFTRGNVSFDHIDTKPEVTKSEMSVFDMLYALNKMLKRKKWKEPMETRITRIDIPLDQRMGEIIDRVKREKQGIIFDELFSYESKSHIVITFIALLELMKKKQITCKQDTSFSSLYIYYHELE